MSKLLRVSRSKYRVVISDVLPYERPVFYSNRFFARFLKYYGIEVEEGMLVARRHGDEPGLKDFLEILGGRKGAVRRSFQYSISKEGHREGRRLTVVHPFHQVEMVDFYDRYKMLIIDYCMRSNFSIRFPYKVADCQKKQKGYHKVYSDDASPVDTSESLKHFFAYKYFKNINFFYGDYRFLRAEKKFRCMTKLDLKHCFDRIQPESLSMAMFDHEMEDCKGSMAYDFWRLQDKFRVSKEGIIIGPEFSRIYAEIILQRIDREVERRMGEEYKVRNRDYIFYRYVDDGFLYYNDRGDRNCFFSLYRSELKKYGLSINKEKVVEFAQRPFVEAISIAKGLILRLINERFQNRLDTFKGFVHSQNNRFDTPAVLDFKTFVNEVRTIMCTCGENMKYKDITSFLLGVIQKRVGLLVRDFNLLYAQYCRAIGDGSINDKGLEIKEKYERGFIDFAKSIVEVVFYFLSCDMRMSTSLKVVSIINKLQLFVRGRYQIDECLMSEKFPAYFVETLDDKISDEIASFLLNATPEKYNLMEILNILEVEKIMLLKNQIAPKVLTDFWKKCEKKTAGLNFFTVFEMLHFIKDAAGYHDLRDRLLGWIDQQVKTLADATESNTEAVLTFMETMCCPWIDQKVKKEYARALCGDASDKLYRFAQKQKNLFIQWHGYRLDEAIQHVNSAEVY